MKTEKIFPIETIGGRIQHLRHTANLSRHELYDQVYPNSAVWSATNKDKTVYNWESGKTELNYENMATICKVLNCSADYLLGLDECTNKTNQFICDQTGLSESNIEKLLSFKKSYPASLDVLNALLQLNSFQVTVNQLGIFFKNFLEYKSVWENKEIIKDFMGNEIKWNDIVESSKYNLARSFDHIIADFEKAARNGTDIFHSTPAPKRSRKMRQDVADSDDQ